jgi:Tol biopolymer transport system component
VCKPDSLSAVVLESERNRLAEMSLGKQCLQILAIVVGLAMSCIAAQPTDPGSSGTNPAIRQLADEVGVRGWIVYASRSEKGDWDLFVCRPDGSAIRDITATADYNEFSPQFSRDGRQLLYRRMARNEKIDNNDHGTQGELVLANSDCTGARVLGSEGEYPWASWSPDGKHIACLSIKGISIVDIAAGKAVRTLERKGIFQQMTWSPDGLWLVGVANSFGTGWSIARIELATGTANAVNRVDCCTPDWFPDNRQVIFSWRPPGQKANKGYGWTQLWMADAEGKSSKLVYGEDGRHVYGGHVSPDGRYVLFTGNMNEDGDPENSGAPMGLMRLSDAPIIGGDSTELRSLHKDVHNGPVLILPIGWEPCWTFAEIGPAKPAASEGKSGMDEEAHRLAAELQDKGWLVFSARTERDDWDLFRMRPDGSDRRTMTNTPEFNEAGPRFSRDGKKLLYYRMPKTEPVDNNTYGTFDLVIMRADGKEPVVYGNEFPWASWGPDGTEIACLTQKAIQIVDINTRKWNRQFPRKGIVEQLVWSPDGKWFAGTANGLGPFWNIGRLNPKSGELIAVSETERYNCTPDWLPDSQNIIYSRGITPDKGGRAELWIAPVDGGERKMLYAEEGRHIYGGCSSPDGKYLLFTRSIEDLGKVDQSQTTLAIIRRADTPMIGNAGEALKKQYPDTKPGPRLDLGAGWEPDWTFADFVAKDQKETK